MPDSVESWHLLELQIGPMLRSTVPRSLDFISTAISIESLLLHSHLLRLLLPHVRLDLPQCLAQEQYTIDE